MIKDFSIEIVKNDRMPAFGGFCRGSMKNGNPVVLLNVEVHFGENHFDMEGNKYEPGSEWRVKTLIETLSHEFAHVLEEYFDHHLTEDEIEKIAVTYRGLSDDDEREGFDFELNEDETAGYIKWGDHDCEGKEACNAHTVTE